MVGLWWEKIVKIVGGREASADGEHIEVRPQYGI
jgi:hypothetical protein